MKLQQLKLPKWRIVPVWIGVMSLIVNGKISTGVKAYSQSEKTFN